MGSRWIPRQRPAFRTLLVVPLALGMVAATANAASAADVACTPSNPALMNFEGLNQGSVNGQECWHDGVTIDATIVDDSGPAPLSGLALRVSNGLGSDGFTNQPIWQPIPAGEGAGEAVGLQPYAELSFDVASHQPDEEQPGLALQVGPDNGAGGRMSMLEISDQAAGLEVAFTDWDESLAADVDGDKFRTTTVASGLSRDQAHSLGLAMTFVPGPGNDIVDVYVDGVWKFTGTSWEAYYAAHGQPIPEVNSFLIRSRANIPGTGGQGLLFDNIYLATGTAPLPIPPTIEQLPQPGPGQPPVVASEAPTDPATGTPVLPAGETVTVTGSGFAPDSEVTVVAYGPDGAALPIAPATTDADGNVTVEVTIPADFEAGEYTLAIVGPSEEDPGVVHAVSSEVVIAAATDDRPTLALPDAVPSDAKALTVSPSSVAAGGKVRLTAPTGTFAPNSKVSLGLYSSAIDLGDTTAEPDGGLSADVVIPSGVAGDHQVLATGYASVVDDSLHANVAGDLTVTSAAQVPTGIPAGLADTGAPGGPAAGIGFAALVLALAFGAWLTVRVHGRPRG